MYEGLLEYDPSVVKRDGKYHFEFIKGDDRSSSGSHYTPDELVQPLIKHSLDYIIQDKLKEEDKEAALLSITVCDVACGSGHILLNAARRIATELAVVRTGEDQPSPSAFRAAIRDVIRNCIYGVDLNPLAVELCKVALWLEAHNPNEPLNFLDHHIKCGNAIVGLAHFKELENGIADEAFKTLPRDDKDIATTFRNKNKAERKTKGQLGIYDLTNANESLDKIRNKFSEFVDMPEATPEEISAKAEAYKKLTSGKGWYRLKQLADLQVAQFFIPKTNENKELLTTDAKYRTYLNSGAQIQDRGAAMAKAVEKRFFHWFLEFPEVFSHGGFDCILGNPPYLGGTKISEKYGEDFFNTIKYYYRGITGRTDLVVNFLRRNSSIIKNEGFSSIVTTNTISQSETRKAGLDFLIKEGFNINFAIPLIKWPGEATLEVSLISITQRKLSKIILRNSVVSRISGFLKEEEIEIDPYKLLTSKNIYTSEGSKIYGDGFIIDLSERLKIIETDTKYSLVLKDYLSGDDLNSTYQIKPTRHVIDLTGLTENEVIKTYPLVFNIIKERVKPYRDTIKDKKAKSQYWLYQRDRKELYNKIAEYQNVIVTAKTTKYINFSLVSPKNIVFSNSVVVIANDKLGLLGVLQSSLHYYWIQKYSSTLESRLRYSPSNVLVNFPMPTGSMDEYSIQNFLKLRNEIMLAEEIGLTKLFNIFNDKVINSDTIISLRNEFKTLDEAVLEAYGWHTDTERWGKAINLRHDFYEVDYLPENDRVRYTIHPEARKEVLKRFVMLNHEMHEAEERNITYEELDAEKTLEIYKGHIKDWLPANNSLHAKTLKFLSSAQELLPTLGSSTAQSYKPFVNQYCSALENELQQKIFVAFNEHFQSQWIGKVEERNSYLKEQMALAHKGSMLFKALKFNSDKYTLGNMHFFLSRIANDNSTTVLASPLLQKFKAFILKRYTSVFINRNTFSDLYNFIKKFRNESAHTGEVDKNMAVECMAEVRKFFKLLVESEIIEEKIIEAKPVKKKTRKSKSKESKGHIKFWASYFI